ncbi:AAA family ATPase [Actinoplanes sp. NPDC048988]|uniref:MinD/ParA family ATP-binding protein n=1 Tax=Actinoplanes sp. NPDC048988 TaxID=3363901 RepID=UPI0037118710
MEGTETGWGRPAEPAPRWRALLDRARHGSRGADDQAEEQEPEAAPPAPQQYGSPLPTRRPTNPLDSRGASYGSRYDQHPAEAPAAAEPPPRAVPQRPINPLDPRWQARSQPAPPPAPSAPSASSPSSPSSSPSGPEPTSFFGPSSRSAPAQPRDYPQARASAAAPVAQPPAASGYPTPSAAPGYSASSGAATGYAGSSGYAASSGAASGYAGSSGAASGYAASSGPAPSYAAPPAAASAFAAPPAAASAFAAPPMTSAPAAPPVPPPAALPAPAPRAAPSPASPTSPAGARIEWRQTRADDEFARAVSVMRRKLGKPRVLAFANPKGGVHKTTATVLAAATIGSVRGRGVLAWDDNELRGTLGLRAGSARHARTIKHLLADLLQIENLHGDALLQELDGYLRHASDGSYDVLAGEENPRFAQRLDQATVRRVMDLLRRTHDVICVDTGNNVESVNWQTVMRQADQLVITTVPREDAAFTADWMLDVLDESGMGDLVSNAVTLISCPSPGPLPLLNDFAKHFATRTRAVAVVPYDPALEVGSSIEYADLQQETRAAWLKAASVMIEPFAE